MVVVDGDGFDSKFRLVVLALQRARQLHGGARPRVDAGRHKYLWIAMREVSTGMVSWEVVQDASQGQPWRA
jgi:DNA-directed RNA polymerase omega subunit